MALFVHKYGGTSVGSVERISHVADHVLAARARGESVVVVVSVVVHVADAADHVEVLTGLLTDEVDHVVVVINPRFN